MSLNYKLVYILGLATTYILDMEPTVIRAQNAQYNYLGMHSYVHTYKIFKNMVSMRSDEAIHMYWYIKLPHTIC